MQTTLRGAVLLCVASTLPITATAQSHDHMGGGPPLAVSALALKQIDSVARAVQPIATTATAGAAGFHPVLGWIPTMGVHWVSTPRIAAGRTFRMDQPANLMFSRINGRDSLVGAAYAFVTAIGDTTRPAAFDGNPPWHEHANFTPPDQTLVMLHVWFVPSPDGPFAGHNPNLPYWAAGVVPPDSARFHAPGGDARVRKTAMALSEVADTVEKFPVLAQRSPLREELAARRDSIRALIPQLKAAQASRDWARWDAAADRAALQWDAIYTAYLAAPRTPDVRERMQRYLDEETTGHHGMNMGAPQRMP
jgi:hypothetical protein